MRNKIVGSIGVFLFVFTFACSFAMIGPEAEAACPICDCWFLCDCPMQWQPGWLNNGYCTDGCILSSGGGFQCPDRCDESIPPC